MKSAPLRIALVALCIGALSCDNGAVAPPTPSSTFGSIKVTVTGAELFQGSVRVTGPGQYDTTIHGTTTLDSLAVGDYQVKASSVTSAGTLYLPAPDSQVAHVAVGVISMVSVGYSAGATTLALTTVVSGLSSPTFLTAPANDQRLFILEQPGRIRIFKNGALLPTPFLDISSKITTGGERGLLGLAFHPQYATNGFFFVYFTDLNGDVTVKRFHATPASDIADTASQLVISIVHREFANHNGGNLLFGPDGMLYMGTGDGGSGGDPHANAQNSGSLLGKILRLDVSSMPYVNIGSEIWAKGVRNPWRFDFRIDPANSAQGDLVIADVGQDHYEEINISRSNQANLNYGWNQMEGFHCYPSGAICALAGMTLPVVEYDHNQGCSITGGFVYRGTAIPALKDQFLYSDYCGGWLRSVNVDPAAQPTVTQWTVPTLTNVTSFGKDANGELYIITGGGTIYKIVAG